MLTFKTYGCIISIQHNDILSWSNPINWSAIALEEHYLYALLLGAGMVRKDPYHAAVPHALPRLGSSAEPNKLDRLFCMHHTSFGVEAINYTNSF